jgi:hypothetical protein
MISSWKKDGPDRAAALQEIALQRPFVSAQDSSHRSPFA